MRVGYEFSFAPGGTELSRAAAGVAAAVGSSLAGFPLSDGSPAYAFGLSVGPEIFPVVVSANVVAPPDIAQRYPFIATLEAELEHDTPWLREMALGLARQCFSGVPLLVTYDVTHTMFEGVGGPDVVFADQGYIAEELTGSKAFAAAAARAREAGYKL